MKNRMGQRALSLLLAIACLVSLLVVPASAEARPDGSVGNRQYKVTYTVSNNAGGGVGDDGKDYLVKGAVVELTVALPDSGDLWYNAGDFVVAYDPDQYEQAEFLTDVSSIGNVGQGSFYYPAQTLDQTQFDVIRDEGRATENQRLAYMAFATDNGKNVEDATGVLFKIRFTVKADTPTDPVSAPLKIVYASYGVKDPNDTSLAAPVDDGIKATQYAINTELENIMLGVSDPIGPDGMTAPDITGTVNEAIVPAAVRLGTNVAAGGRFEATGLPAGLTINTGTGVISGSPTVAGVYSATAKYYPPSGAPITDEFTVIISDVKSGLLVTVDPTAQVYDGTAKTPAITVRDRETGAQLSPDDYVAVYSNNVNAGIGAMVTVYSKTGAKSGWSNFTIEKAEQVFTFDKGTENLSVTYGESFVNPAQARYDDPTLTWTVTSVGGANANITGEGIVTPTNGLGAVTVTVSATETANAKAGSASYVLSLNRAMPALSFAKGSISASLTGAAPENPLTVVPADLTVTYTSSNPGVAAVDPASGAVTLAAQGITTITATTARTDRYEAGSASYLLTVVGDGALTYTAQSYTGVYDGQPHSITVTADDPDATVTYSESAAGTFTDTNPAYTDAGVHTVYFRVSKTGSTTVTGSAVVAITPATLTDAVVAEGGTYDGTAKTPAVSGVVADALTGLVEGRDYKLSYSNNVNAGTGTVTVTGINNFTGELTREFTIAQRTLTEAMVKDIPEQIYTGRDVTPEVTVLDETLAAGGPVLYRDRDYTVSYADNRAVGVNTASATVTGTGNYTGTVTKYFTITNGPILKVLVDNTKTAYNGTEQTAKVAVYSVTSVTDPDGTVRQEETLLTEGTDYELAGHRQTAAGVYLVQVTGKTGTAYDGKNATGIFVIERAERTGRFTENDVTVMEKTVNAVDVKGAPTEFLTLKLGEEYISADATEHSGATKTWRSSAPEVATVDAAGQVTVLKPGAVTITVQVAETANFRGVTAQYTLTALATVTLDENGDAGPGVTTTTVHGKVGEAIPYTAPTRTGYVFAGWSTQPGSGAVGNPGVKFSEDLDGKTLYAVWIRESDAKQYTVTFQADDGVIDGPTTLTTNTSGTLEGQTLPTAMRTSTTDGTQPTDYTFSGWYTPEGEKVEVTTIFTQNTTVVARWKYTPQPDPTDPPYIITFEPNGGALTAGESTATTDAKGKLTADQFPTAARASYTFLGWFTAPSGGVSVNQDTAFFANTTVYAHWDYTGAKPELKPGDEGFSATVTFDPNGGTAAAGAPASLTTDQNGTLAGQELPADPVRPGYRFDGWFTASVGGVQVGEATVFSADATVYAHWSQDPASKYFQITFDANNGVWTGGAATKTVNTDETTGKVAEADWPAEPTRSGYEFTGWYTATVGGAEVTKESVFGGATTVYARWQAVGATFDITFDGNGGTPATQTMKTQEDGTLAALPAAAPAKPGHEFVGWYTKTEGGILVVSAAEATETVPATIFTENTTVYALWRIDPNSSYYTVTFDANEGAWADGVTTMTRMTDETTGTVAAADWPAAPSREGYEFLGWYTAQEGGAAVENTAVFGGDTTLYAQWKKLGSTYTVTFLPNGGLLTGSSTLTTNADGVLTGSFPTATRENHELIGWFTAPSGGVSVDAATVFFEDTTVYAHWTYTGRDPGGKPGDADFSAAITLDPNGGALPEGAVNPMNTDQGGLLADIPTPTLANYTFLGWFTAKEGGVKVDETTVFRADATIYAHWIREGSVPDWTYTITFIGNGGEPPIASKTTNANGTLTGLPAVARTGYTFLYWSTATVNGTKVTESTVFSGDTTVYAIWAKNGEGDTPGTTPVDEENGPFTVTFDPQNGTVDPASAQTDENGKVSLPTPTRVDYAFQGWFTEADGKGYQVTDDTIYAEDTTVYAYWKQTVFTVTFNPNGGALAGEGSGKTNGNGDGKLAALPGDPTPPDGKEFLGWYTAETGGVKVDENTVFTADATIYAHYRTEGGETPEPMPGDEGFSATVSFDSNSGGAVANPGDVVTDKDGRLGENLPGALTWAGYEFGGWWTEPNGGYQVTGETVFSGNATVYAHWTQTVFTVTFYPGYPNGDTTDTPVETKTTVDGKLNDLPNAPVRDGYDFVDWYTGAVGGVQVTTDMVFTSDTAAYAHWTKRPDGTEKQYTITFNGNGGTPATQTKTTDGATGKLSAGDLAAVTEPTREGYTFQGWYTATENGMEVTEELVFGGDTMVYAIWKDGGQETPDDKKPPFTITFNAANGTMTNEDGVNVQVMTQKTDAAGKLSGLPTPTREGYAFDGWYTQNGYRVTENTIYEENTVLYAGWFEAWTVTFDMNGGSLVSGSLSILTDKDGKLSESIPAVIRRDYYLVGWFTVDGVEVDMNTVFTQNTTVKASWTQDPEAAKKYIITFDPNGGTLSGSSTLTTNASGTLEGQTLPSASRSAHSFNGWYYNGAPVTTSTIFTSDAIVYAKWTGTGTSGGGTTVELPGYQGCKRDEKCPIWAFTDARMSAWYHDGVHYCLENGLMIGVGDNKFAPEGIVTRAQIVTVLWRLSGSPDAGANTFVDVRPGSYYEKAVAWAAKAGVVTGYGNGYFGPDDALTRQQLATILYRYAGYSGLSLEKNGNLTRFTDLDQVSGYAVEAITWAHSQGLIIGITATTLVPQGNANRAQLATVMMRFCENILK